MAILGAQLKLAPRLKGALQSAVAETPPASTTKQGAINLDNILKLIPGDVVSLFITGAGLTVAVKDWTAICFWVCMAVCLVIRILASRPAGVTGFSLKGVNWSLTLATMVAFFVWAHAVSSSGPVFPDFHGPVAGFFAMVFGIVAPLLVRTE